MRKPPTASTESLVRSAKPLIGKTLIGSVGVALVIIMISLFLSAASEAAGVSHANVPPASRTPDDVWTSSWTASPEGSTRSFDGQTLRQILHTSVSGTTARVQLSNATGRSAVTISDVHIAQRSAGSFTDAGTDQVITFSGSTTITIAPGATIASDTIAFAVQAGSDVAISFYLPQQTLDVASDRSGEQTNYISSGDVAGDATLIAPEAIGSYYLLTNLDVRSLRARPSAPLGTAIPHGIASDL
jgi:hypothetical protein